MGVDLIVGVPWSSMAYPSLDYANENDMLIVSYGATSQTLAIPDDYLFRICADDGIQGIALAQMISSQGISKVVVIQRDDSWGNGLYDVFQAEFEGTILGRFNYPPDTESYHSYLQLAEISASFADNVAVLLMSYDETTQIITEASETDTNGALLYPNIYGQGSDPRDIPWFGTDTIGRPTTTLDEAPEQAEHLKLLSPLSAPTPSSKYDDLAERFLQRTGYEANYFTATMADACWLLVQSVLETQCSTSGADIANVFPSVASRYYGYSGWCLLNEAGDRETCNFNICGFYRKPDGTVDIKAYGYYEGTTNELTWYDN
jgi:branched-chain amino acid transport system substrate-binding protein